MNVQNMYFKNLTTAKVLGSRKKSDENVEIECTQMVNNKRKICCSNRILHSDHHQSDAIDQQQLRMPTELNDSKNNFQLIYYFSNLLPPPSRQ